ncbi:MAG: hypothetical protein A2X86_13850 [Bdellovibrionales bacterium GWA2_49_15]|nr:MAG: hypothetical protein A2X86_13850 [Bdellovibrionales bacterium GWA2_49_15]HAZ13611.1 hypothetical protein [Bdellovibrionales bacterium]
MRKTNKKSAAEPVNIGARNITKAKLKGTPFTSAEDLKAAQSAILSETWKKLEKARAKRELTKRDEFKFYVDTFRKGLHCKYVDNANNIVGIALDDDDVIKISISEQVLPRKNSDQELLGVLIQSMSATFLQSYLKAMDILEEPLETEEHVRLAKQQCEKYKSKTHERMTD